MQIALLGLLLDNTQRVLWVPRLFSGRVIPTAAGIDLRVGRDGSVITLTPTAGGVSGRLVEVNIPVCEGVVHITDTVYVPSNI